MSDKESKAPGQSRRDQWRARLSKRYLPACGGWIDPSSDLFVLGFSGRR